MLGMHRDVMMCMTELAGAEKAETSSASHEVRIVSGWDKELQEAKQQTRTILKFWSSQEDKWVGNARQRQAGNKITFSDTMQTYSSTVAP